MLGGQLGAEINRVRTDIAEVQMRLQRLELENAHLREFAEHHHNAPWGDACDGEDCDACDMFAEIREINVLS